LHRERADIVLLTKRKRVKEDLFTKSKRVKEKKNREGDAEICSA
jgi:hypothetical protein